MVGWIGDAVGDYYAEIVELRSPRNPAAADTRYWVCTKIGYRRAALRIIPGATVSAADLIGHYSRQAYMVRQSAKSRISK